MGKLVLKKSLAQDTYVKNLVVKTTCQVKENVIDYADHKLDPQLVNCIMNFIEKEISKGKYCKKEFDKSKILQDIIVSIFGELNEAENKWLESTIQHIIDNKLVKKNTLFLKGWDILKTVVTTSAKYL
jgi:predicted transcriptional regulator